MRRVCMVEREREKSGSDGGKKEMQREGGRE